MRDRLKNFHVYYFGSQTSKDILNIDDHNYNLDEYGWFNELEVIQDAKCNRILFLNHEF